MNTKEIVIEMFRHMPDNATLSDIVSALSTKPTDADSMGAESVDDRDPAQAEKALGYSLEEISDDDWALFVAQGLADELSDPREHTYSLTDGEPANEPG